MSGWTAERPARRPAARILWAAALMAGVLWPGRLVGPLDGVPLDRPLEALSVALLVPALLMLRPSFLDGNVARTVIVILLAWKAAGSAVLPQTGWCGQFFRPAAAGEQYGLERSWDLRAAPGCSAVVARPYRTLADFPAWTMNLLSPNVAADGERRGGVEPARPPDARSRLVVTGAFRTARPGTFSLDVGGDVRLEGTAGGQSLHPRRGGRTTVPLEAGEHVLHLSLELTGSDWAFVPRWNERDVFTAVPTGVQPGRTPPAVLYHAGRWVAPVLVLPLLLLWTVSAARSLRPSRTMALWCAGSSAVAGLLAFAGPDGFLRVGALGLLAAALVPVPPHLRTWRGLVLLAGAPWLTICAVQSLDRIGRFTLFSRGDDWLVFQRYAHRIYLEGYWLEGGEPTFWFQPLYRWTTGALHLIFGDSSAGDLYWDAFGLLVAAILAFEIVSRAVGFRAGIGAAVLSLAVVVFGPNWHVVGRGLSEISATAWLALAALSLLHARPASKRHAALAGVFAVLAFYTRLNHLPLVLALVAFALPDREEAGAFARCHSLWDRLPKAVAGTYLSVVAMGVALFACRTWYYTGALSLFGGTTIVYNGTGLGRTLESFWSAEAWGRALESVAMIVTVQDPPGLDVRALPVVAGVAAAVLGLLGVPVARRLPLHLAVVCIAAVLGGLVARGLAYPGRFSIHLIPLAVAATVCTAAFVGRLPRVAGFVPSRLRVQGGAGGA